MNINTIRSIIRKTVRKQLKEAAEAAAGPPKTFKDFRVLVGSLMSDAGAPEELVEEINDVGLEGGGVAEVLWSTWNDFSSDIWAPPAPGSSHSLQSNDFSSDIEEDGDWKETLSFYASDMVLDIVDAFSNTMNYEPGRRVPHIDGKMLADDVLGALTSSGSGDGNTPDRALRDMAGLVTDILEQCGCAENVKWDGKNTVSYSILGDVFQFYTAVEEAATGPAGLTLEDKTDTYRDTITGLSVTFSDGIATIS